MLVQFYPCRSCIDDCSKDHPDSRKHKDMYRKPLRSSKGCLRCRQRRIKCDETYPICAGCARWKFQCIWPTRQKRTPNEHEADSTKTLLAMNKGKKALSLQCYQDGYLAAGYESFRNDEERQLVESAVEFVRRYTSEGIGTDRGSMSFIMTLILQSSWNRLALSAFSANTISRWDNRFKAIAVSSYQTALVELRFNLSTGSISDTDIRVLTSMFFLGMLEYFAYGNFKTAFSHFSIITRMAIVHQEKLSINLHDASTKWTISMINMSLVLCGNFYLIEPRLSTLFEGAWDTLDAFIHRCVQPMADIYKICLPEDSLKTRAQLHINRLIFKGPDPVYVQTAFREIARLEKFIATNPVSTQVSLSNSKLGWASDISAMRLFVTALSKPGACSNDRQLRALADEWETHNTNYLQSLDQSMPHMEILLPMTKLSLMSHLGVAIYYLPLLCMAHDLERFEQTVNGYKSFTLVMNPDLAEKIQRIIETIRLRKKTVHCTLETEGKCSKNHDGLDILRHPQGVLC